jgi:poly(3-hydroxybutyrate) depolymerase
MTLVGQATGANFRRRYVRLVVPGENPSEKTLMLTLHSEDLTRNSLQRTAGTTQVFLAPNFSVSAPKILNPNPDIRESEPKQKLQSQ